MSVVIGSQRPFPLPSVKRAVGCAVLEKPLTEVGVTVGADIICRVEEVFRHSIDGQRAAFAFDRDNLANVKVLDPAANYPILSICHGSSLNVYPTGPVVRTKKTLEQRQTLRMTCTRFSCLGPVRVHPAVVPPSMLRRLPVAKRISAAT